MSSQRAAPSRDAVDPVSLWRHRPFLLFWGGQAVSELGSQVSVLVLPFIAATALGASIFGVAALSVLNTAPSLLFALPAGVAVDRVRRHGLMLWCNGGRLVLFASIPVMAMFGRVTLWQLYVVAGASGVLTVFFDVAYQSYLPSLVGPDLLVDGNGKLGTSEAFAQFSGPLLGGALVGLVGAAWAVAVDAASYAVCTVTLMSMGSREPVSTPAVERPAFRAALVEGLSFVFRHPVLRKIIACSTTASFFAGSVQALSVVYLTRVLHAAAGTIGLVFSLAAAGGIVGGLVAGRLAKRVGSARIIWLSLVACGPFYFLIPLARPGWGALLFSGGWAFFTFTSVVYNAAQVAYRQSICPRGMLGRLTACFRSVVWGALPLGQLTGGAVAGAIGIRSTLWFSVIGIVVAPAWILASPLRAMRDFP